jgi:hypothetical protein
VLRGAGGQYEEPPAVAGSWIQRGTLVPHLPHRRRVVRNRPDAIKAPADALSAGYDRLPMRHEAGACGFALNHPDNRSGRRVGRECSDLRTEECGESDQDRLSSDVNSEPPGGQFRMSTDTRHCTKGRRRGSGRLGLHSNGPMIEDQILPTYRPLPRACPAGLQCIALSSS